MKILSPLLIVILTLALALPNAQVAAQTQTELMQEMRTETSLIRQYSDGHHELYAYGSPINYWDGSSWKPINNRIANDTMSQDSYIFKVLQKTFNQGQIMEFSSRGASVRFQPMALEWTNDLQQIQQISMPQTVVGTIVNEAASSVVNAEYQSGKIRWDNAYGQGRHFEWACDVGVLRKMLQIDNPLPPPQQYIIDGGNPVLRLNFIFDPGNTDIYMDGSKWDKKTRKTTFNQIEFKLGNQTVWYFRPAICYDTAGDQVLIQTELRKSGNDLYVSCLLPYQWLLNATYPIYIDPSISPYSSTYDGNVQAECTNCAYSSLWNQTTGAVHATDADTHIGQIYQYDEEWGWWWYYIMRSFFFFDTSPIPSNANIDSASLYLYGYQNVPGPGFYITIQNGQPDRPNMPLQSSDYNRTYYSGNGGQLHTSNFITTGYNVIQMTELGWVTKGGWTKLCVRSSREIAGTAPTGNEYVRAYTADQAGTDKDPYLYVSYTVPAEASISLQPTSYDFGIVIASQTYATGLTYFTVTNNGSVSVDITISGTDMTGGGYTWTLSDTATPGNMVYGLKAGLEGGDYTIIIKKTSPYNTLVSGLGVNASQKFGVKLYSPTAFADYNSKSGNITLTAVAS